MAHAGGRPPKYSEVEEVQKIIDEYFDYCDNRTKRVWNNKKAEELLVIDPEPYTMSGLAYALGLSRQALKEYKDSDKFGDAIKRAREKVETDIERRMNDKATFTPGLIFNAKNNFGWKEEIHNDLTTGGEPFIFTRGEKKDE